jgi:hypothetical protein
MRGHIRKRYKDSWSIILDLGYQIVPATGHMKRVQKWFTVQGTKRDAERKLIELLQPASRRVHRTLQVDRRGVAERVAGNSHQAPQ